MDELTKLAARAAETILDLAANPATRTKADGSPVTAADEMVHLAYVNPQTGEEITIKPSKQPRFRAGKQLKDSLN